MRFVDTHCHLDFEAYEHDIEEVIKRSVDRGVTRIVVPGLNIYSSRKIIRLVERFPEVYGAIGVHPGDVDTWKPEQATEFETLAKHKKVVAIGEIGLDYYHRQDNFPLQKDILNIFLDLADLVNKPVILHSRNCLHDLVNMIDRHNEKRGVQSLRGVFHAYEGDLTDAQSLTQKGYYLGVGGPITYKNAATKQEVFSKIYLSQILLETDGPFLAPQSQRGKRNEPAWIPTIAERIADLRHCDITEVAEATTLNAQNLFYWN